jgi:hypothetical protein
MADLVGFSINAYHGSRVAFIKDWFEKLRLHNELEERGSAMSFSSVRSLLLRAVRDDDHLPDAFTELTFKEHSIGDIESMKLHLLHKAGLYDGKDKSLRNRGTNSSNAYAIHNAYVINSTTRNPEARLPDHLFKAMTQPNRSEWIKLSEDTRMFLLKYMDTDMNTSTPDRRVYAHDFHLASEHAGYVVNNSREDQSVPMSELSVDPNLVKSITDLIVNATQRQSDDTVTTQGTGSTRSKKTPRKLPLLTTMSPAHPAAVLSDTKTRLYDEDGNHRGSINNKKKW